MKEVRVAIIGFGGIAKAHKNSYKILAEQGTPVNLIAACDIDPNRFTDSGSINLDTGNSKDMTGITFYTDLEEMLSKEEIDMVDICLPTYLHAKTAIQMLERGYHVLSEKPMARTFADCTLMLEAASRAKGKLMIGQCLRFFPQYQFLKEVVEDNRYGKVISGFFDRLSMPPVWGWNNWFMDFEKSGGCILDLHIHDIDMARFLFGEPIAVSCNTANVTSGCDTVNTRLYYNDDKLIVANGDWSLQKSFGFRHGYRVNFEKATILFENGEVKIYSGDNAVQKPEISKDDGFTGEIKYFIDLIVNNKDNLLNSPESAANSVKLVEMLIKSAKDSGVKIEL